MGEIKRFPPVTSPIQQHPSRQVTYTQNFFAFKELFGQAIRRSKAHQQASESLRQAISAFSNVFVALNANKFTLKISRKFSISSTKIKMAF